MGLFDGQEDGYADDEDGDGDPEVEVGEYGFHGERGLKIAN